MGTWMIRLLRQLLTVASGPLRQQLTEFAKKFREEAKATPNPWDDVLADVICWLLGVE